MASQEDSPDWKGSKTCTACGQTKQFAEFYKNNGCAHGFDSKCKACVSARAKKKRAENLEKVREMDRLYHKKAALKNPGKGRVRHLKYRYGLTPADVEALFGGQGRQCAICKSKKPHRKNGRWNVDHDHKTGKVRGVVCSHCNRLLGAAYDDIEVLRAAIGYLVEASPP